MENNYLLRLLELPYTILVLQLGILASLTFLALPKEKKKKPEFLFSFLYITLVAFYENFSLYLLVDKNLNSFFHSIISDTEFKGWNLWSYNLLSNQISELVLSILILGFIYDSFRRKILKVVIFMFIISCIALQAFGIQPLYASQPIIYLLGNSSLILACGLYFIDLISHEKHLSINPLMNWKFWISTSILFECSLVFLVDAAFSYLAFQNIELYNLFNLMAKTLSVILLLVMTLFLFSGVIWNKTKISNNYDVTRG